MHRESAPHTLREHRRLRSIRSTLAGLLVVPLISLLALWGYAASSTVGAAVAERNYNTLNSDIGASSQAMLVQLVQERALTFVWLSSGRRMPRAGMDAQRALTDAAIAKFRSGSLAAAGVLTPQARQDLTTLLTKLGQLGGIRAAADAGATQAIATFGAYNAVVDAFFPAFQSQAAFPGISAAVYQQAEGNLDGGQALELVGREIALVGGAQAAGGPVSQAAHDLFAQTVEDQRLLEQQALSLLAGPAATAYQQLFASGAYRNFQALENRIVASRPGSRVPVSPVAWQSAAQAFLAAFNQVAGTGRESVTKGIAHDGDVTLLRLFLIGGAGLAAVVVSSLLLLGFSRRITRELRNFLLAVRALADERLPDLMIRLRAGEDVDVEAEAPPLAIDTRIRETAEIAEAFSAVQRTAVEAAVGQARLRNAFGRVFRSLARRNQSLLQRQLKMLDEMERGAQDPDALEQLFRLDHLTTRMRRHAEGLIILSGAAPGRGWRQPVPVVEVLRGAIGEIEDYVRVDMATDSPDFLRGAAVADATHLLAELIENAVSYSPPSTQVQVKGGRVANGYVVEVEDRGLGIQASVLAVLNQRLARPPEFDLADTDQLGLFVVSRLADRHGIKVTLRESAYGGTIAIVLLPPSVVVTEEEAAVLATRGTAGGTPMGGAIGTPMSPLDTGLPVIEPGSVRTVAARQQASNGFADPSQHPGAPSGTSGPGPGLPRRSRMASLAPQLRDGLPAAARGGASGGRSPEQARSLMASIQRGLRSGRAEADRASGDASNANPPNGNTRAGWGEQ